MLISFKIKFGLALNWSVIIPRSWLIQRFSNYLDHVDSLPSIWYVFTEIDYLLSFMGKATSNP